MKFSDFQVAVAKQFQEMTKTGLYVVDVDGDSLWDTYLSSFPEGSNPIYRERTEHDCSSCRGFIKKAGAIVRIMDHGIETIWDVQVGGAYQVVADAMSEIVRLGFQTGGISNVYLHDEKSVGTKKNRELLEDKSVIDWTHFYVNLPKTAYSTDVATERSKIRSTKDVMLRSLREITAESVETVLDIIAQGSLYRGDEQKHAVESFDKIKRSFDKITDGAQKELFVWKTYDSVPQAVARIRNTAIGTLLVDLSEDKGLEASVKAFESIMAPANYKRPTALISKAMIKRAKERIEALGFTSALERRYAVLEDITINNVLFADREARKEMNVFDELADSVPEKVRSLDKVEEVKVEEFITNILPRAKSIEIMVENRHASNLVSLVAPVDPTAKRMFHWPNNFSWAYSGDLADSDIRREVQARGGSVTGVFRFSHQWNYGKRNASLMDLHVFMPGSSIGAGSPTNDNYGRGRRVGWNQRQDIQSGGIQDVDYTAAAPEGHVPVENITFPSLSRMPQGRYICKIHNWHLRQPTQGGFRAEIEFGGEVFQYEVDRPLKNKEWVAVAEVTLKGGVFTINHLIPHGATSKVMWGVPTQTFRKVNVIMRSPNYWDGAGVGNQHYFFMLDGCQNEGRARGFFNEFLTNDLAEHRKVFEQVGAKMKTEEEDRQLSGLGFSSTKREKILCRVQGGFSRTVQITF